MEQNEIKVQICNQYLSFLQKFQTPHKDRIRCKIYIFYFLLYGSIDVFRQFQNHAIQNKKETVYFMTSNFKYNDKLILSEEDTTSLQ